MQNEKINRHRTGDDWLKEHVPELQTSMIETAEIVAERYGVSRDAQDEYALQSQQRTAQAQSASFREVGAQQAEGIDSSVLVGLTAAAG